MKVFVVFFFSLVFFISQLENANSLVAVHEGFRQAKLTRAVVRSSDWLKQFYAKTSFIQPHTASSMIVSLRIAGHQPDTLLSNFKSSFSLSINETLKNYLDNEINTRGNLTFIPTGQLAYIVQAVIAICEDPSNFSGHNLYATLRSGIMTFKTRSNFNNYFQYSLVAIAFYNGGFQVPETMVKELLKGVYRKPGYHSIDTNALILTALSCVKSSSMSNEVNKATTKLVNQLITQQNKSTGAFGNQYSTALAAEALIAALGNHTDMWDYVKAMENILSYQDDEGSFGGIIANIQITPSLLGESMIQLSKLECPIKAPVPKKVRTFSAKKSITVHVNLDFGGNVKKPEPPKVAVKSLEGATAYDILQKAKEQNDCYTAKYKISSLGRFITAICNVSYIPHKNLYWMIYVNGQLAKYGVDLLKPKDGALLTFKYQIVNSQKPNNANRGFKFNLLFYSVIVLVVWFSSNFIG